MCNFAKAKVKSFVMAHIQQKLLLCLLFLQAISMQAQQKSELSDSTLMQEVRVNGQRQRISYRLDRQRIDAGQVLTAQGGTAFDVLRAVPGVTVDADGNLSFRGSQNFLVYVDGKLYGEKNRHSLPNNRVGFECPGRQRR